jgi:hypothetical protein
MPWHILPVSGAIFDTLPCMLVAKTHTVAVDQTAHMAHETRILLHICATSAERNGATRTHTNQFKVFQIV